jgi:hypothetical protein
VKLICGPSGSLAGRSLWRTITAATTAAANIQGNAPERRELVEKRDNVVIFFLFGAVFLLRRLMGPAKGSRGSSLPIRPGSVISADFIARLIKGCRGGVPAGCFV